MITPFGCETNRATNKTLLLQHVLAARAHAGEIVPKRHEVLVLPAPGTLLSSCLSDLLLTRSPRPYLQRVGRIVHRSENALSLVQQVAPQRCGFSAQRHRGAEEAVGQVLLGHAPQHAALYPSAAPPSRTGHQADVHLQPAADHAALLQSLQLAVHVRPHRLHALYRSPPPSAPTPRPRHVRVAPLSRHLHVPLLEHAARLLTTLGSLDSALGVAGEDLLGEEGHDGGVQPRQRARQRSSTV